MRMLGAASVRCSFIIALVRGGILTGLRIVRQLGAIWWKSEDTYTMSLLDETWRGDDAVIRVGWPAAGGVWVLKTTKDEAHRKGVAIIHNAYNMEERCEAIKQLGGVFYADPKDCPDLDLA
jgi:hypothetical protein